MDRRRSAIAIAAVAALASVAALAATGTITNGIFQGVPSVPAVSVATDSATASPPPTPTTTPTPTPTPTPPGVVQFGPSVSVNRLLGAIADESVDVIELTAGTYTPGTVNINVDRSRPLVIRPAAGATVVFANGTDAAFLFGYGGRAGNITIQGLIFDGYHIGSIGIIWIGNAHDIAVNDMTVRNSTGEGDNSWAFYLSTDNGVGPSNITANNWVVDGGGRTLGGFQTYHNPNVHGATLLGWKIRNCTYAIYAHSDATALTIDDWTIDSCGITVDAYLSVVFRNVSGVIRNVHATNSARPDIRLPMVNGGGNSWR